MSEQTEPRVEGWKRGNRPPILEKRFEFESYAQTRAFLEHLEQLSEAQGIYPDLSFSRRRVNVALSLDVGDSKAIRASEQYASAADQF